MSKIKFFLKYTNFFPRSDWEQVRKDTRAQSPKSNKLQCKMEEVDNIIIHTFRQIGW